MTRCRGKFEAWRCGRGWSAPRPGKPHRPAFSVVTRIRWTTGASDQLEAIVRRIREDNPEAARLPLNCPPPNALGRANARVPARIDRHAPVIPASLIVGAAFDTACS